MAIGLHLTRKSVININLNNRYKSTVDVAVLVQRDTLEYLNDIQAYFSSHTLTSDNGVPRQTKVVAHKGKKCTRKDEVVSSRTEHGWNVA